MWKCAKRCQQYCTAAAYRSVKRGRAHYHRARLLKEQSLGPEVLRGRRKPLRNTRGARWVGTARTNGSFPREGRMLRAVPDPPADLHPRKSACAGEKSRRKGPGETGERRKRERARKTA